MPRRMDRILTGIVVLLLLLPECARAHHGEVAAAVPLEGIAIDGDLADWPAGMRKYPIAFNGRGGERIHGWFRVGYSATENALYLAVEAADDSVMVDTSGGGDWRQDGCSVFVDAPHEEGERSLGCYQIIGNSMRSEGQGTRRADFEAAVRRTVRSHQYEWRLDIREKTGGEVLLRPGMSLGLGVHIWDSDAEDALVIWKWGRQGYNWSSENMGDVVLLGVGSGELEGRVRWEESGEGIRRGQVHIQALDSPQLWLRAGGGGEGRFAVELPPGRYRVRRTWPGPGEEKIVGIESGRTIEVDLSAPLPRGRSVPAGQGKGHWQNFSVVDGLSSNTVYDILQDREGDLWFATEVGASRYDGRTFTSFTRHSGLAGNWVEAVLEDREGNIWFGTGEGASRYDGRQFTSFTQQDGLPGRSVDALAQDRNGDLWFGTSEGVSRYDGEAFTTVAVHEGIVFGIRSIFQDRMGNLWFGTNGGGVSKYDGAEFSHFNTEDGLPANVVLKIAEDSAGNMWFGCLGGLVRYDGTAFATFTTEDGLPHDNVREILVDRTGNLWLGTGSWEGGGRLTRYDGTEFVRFSTEDGLAHNTVSSCLEDREGNLWFGTGTFGSGGGVSRYSGEQFTTFNTEDGLPGASVRGIIEDPEGNLWFGTVDPGGGKWGLSRYDGETFLNFLREDGLGDRVMGFFQDAADNLWFGNTRYDGKQFEVFYVQPRTKDRAGNLWFAQDDSLFFFDGERFAGFGSLNGLGTWQAISMLVDRGGYVWTGSWIGVFRHDGRKTVKFTAADGLGDDGVTCLLEDEDGTVWLGTKCGLSRYDGEGFTNFTMEDGLAANWVSAIIQDREGRLLVGTLGGGVSLYDGRVFQSLTSEDGLAGDMVDALYQDSRGDIWIGTHGGVTRYRPGHAPPPVRVTRVVVDRDYGEVEEIQLPTTQDYLAFEFEGRSFKTRPGQLAYVYRLQGHDEEWRTTRQERVVYEDLPRGEYLFEVRAVDRDLDYSKEPAWVRVMVHLPRERIAFTCALVLAFIGLIAATGYGVRRRRDLRRTEQALMREMEEELQTAHEMQMGLMPKEAPNIEGFDIAGRCLTANHVGGDFFQYFHDDGKLTICLADVTGHAMEAAIPAVMFSGILENQMEFGFPLQELFDRLNRSLHRILDARTYVCLAMGELDIATSAFRFSNGACPPLYHFRASTGQVEELEIEAYPLGVLGNSSYPVVDVQLEPGDRIVFCSDGIIEAEHPENGLFGFERTMEVVRQGCVEGLNAEGLIERLIGSVKSFSEDGKQEDDITVVVLRVEGK